MKNVKEKLIQRIADQMAKPPDEQLKILRENLGDEEVDAWELTWARAEADTDMDTD